MRKARGIGLTILALVFSVWQAGMGEEDVTTGSSGFSPDETKKILLKEFETSESSNTLTAQKTSGNTLIFKAGTGGTETFHLNETKTISHWIYWTDPDDIPADAYFIQGYIRINYNPDICDVTAVELGLYDTWRYSRGQGYVILWTWQVRSPLINNPSIVAFKVLFKGKVDGSTELTYDATDRYGTHRGWFYTGTAHRFLMVPVRIELQTPPVTLPNVGRCTACEEAGVGKDARVTDGNGCVDCTSGNLNLSQDQTHIVPTTALPTNLTLYYNSLGYDIPDNPVGPKWTHTFNQRIITQTDGSLVHLMECGKLVHYILRDGETNIYDSDPASGLYSTIRKDDNYVLTQKDRTKLTFNPAGKFLSADDRNGNKVTTQYTGDNLTRLTLPNGVTMEFTYTGKLLTGLRDPAANLTQFSYNADGQLTSRRKSGDANDIWSWTYHPGANLVASQTNPLGKTTQFTFQTDKLIRITNPDRIDKVFSYDDAKSETVITDRHGKNIRVKWDKTLDTWLEYEDALGNISRQTFDSQRNLTSRTNPRLATTGWGYDDRGNVLTQTNAAGYRTLYYYEDPDNPDLPTRITDALGVVTRLEYDSKGNLIARKEGWGTMVEQVIEWEYYANGQVKKETRDPLGLNLTTNHYYTNGYLTQKVIDEPGLNIIHKTDYDILGEIIKTYCPRSLQPAFEYTYDYRGNRISIRTYTAPGISYLSNLEYDLTDNLTSRTEDVGGLNIVTEYIYNNVGNLIRTTLDPAGLNIITSNSYDNEGRLIRTIDPEGVTTEYEYYDNGWLKLTRRQLTASEYAVTQYSYDENGNLTQTTDPEGHLSLSSYTILDQLETTTDPENNITRYGYNALGLTVWTEDARGNRTDTFYDELRRVKYVRTPEANITTAYKYDKAGRTIEVIGPWYDTNQNGDADDADSADISYSEYDKADRLVKSWVNNHPMTLYEYDKASNVIRITDPASQITESQYDRCHQLVMTTIDPGGLNERTFYKYDNLGRQIEVTIGYGTPLATMTYSVYDNANRLITQYTNNLTYATTYEYNKRGQQIKVTDAELRSTLSAYDLGGRLIRTTDARGYNVDYTYDKDGNRSKVTYYRNGQAVNTFYTYYKNHLLRFTDYPGFNGRNITANNYDGNGNLTSKTDTKGQTITYQYDKNNRLTLKQCNTETVTYTYNGSSNLLTLIDTNTDELREYDDLSRLTRVTNNKYSPAKVIQYTYWEDGLRKTMLDAEGNLTEYSYDRAKRLQQVTRNGVTEGTYSYNTLGLRTRLTYGNGAYADYEYNHPLWWLTKICNLKSDNSVISSFAYQHDQVGNRTRMTLADGDYLDYQYDEIYQLTRETRKDKNDKITYDIQFTYDEVGNRLTQNKDGVVTTYTYNDANQLISETTNGTTSTYEFDQNGNQVRKITGSEVLEWAYDYENRQISYKNSLNSGTYWYDAFGNRSRKTSVVAVYKNQGNQNASNKIGVGNGKGQGLQNGQGTQNAIQNQYTIVTTTEQYILDGANVIADYDESNNLLTTYLTPFLDQNLLIISGTNTYYYMADGLGSIRNLVDSVSSVVNSYDYSAFGEMLSETEGVPQRYKFTAREWDSESNTYCYRTRYYNPYIGRFNQKDPFKFRLQSLSNLYRYVSNNPNNWIDPSGLVEWSYIMARVYFINFVHTRETGVGGVRVDYQVYAGGYPRPLPVVKTGAHICAIIRFHMSAEIFADIRSEPIRYRKIWRGVEGVSEYITVLVFPDEVGIRTSEGIFLSLLEIKQRFTLPVSVIGDSVRLYVEAKNCLGEIDYDAAWFDPEAGIAYQGGGSGESRQLAEYFREKLPYWFGFFAALD